MSQSLQLYALGSLTAVPKSRIQSFADWFLICTVLPHKSFEWIVRIPLALELCAIVWVTADEKYDALLKNKTSPVQTMEHITLHIIMRYSYVPCFMGIFKNMAGYQSQT